MSRHEQQQHHNLVVSYETSIDKSISKEYSEYRTSVNLIKGVADLYVLSSLQILIATIIVTINKKIILINC